MCSDGYHYEPDTVESLEARLEDSDPPLADYGHAQGWRLSAKEREKVAEDAIAVYDGLRQAVRLALRCNQCKIGAEHRSMLEAYMDEEGP